jgi:hypothetical protein
VTFGSELAVLPTFFILEQQRYRPMRSKRFENTSGGLLFNPHFLFEDHVSDRMIVSTPVFMRL